MGKNRNGGEGDEEVIRTTGTLLTSLTKDPSILESIYNLFPKIEKIQMIHDRHRNLFNEVLGGALDKEEELQAARIEATNQVSLLHGLAQLTGKHDPSIPQKLGVVMQQLGRKSGAATIALTATENFRLVYEGRKIVARASAVKGARSYEIGICEGDPMIEGNWRHHATSGRVTRIELTDLTPGRLCYFRIRAVGSHGTGPWSNFVSMMAI
jgi:hypothetical protein